MNFKSIGLNTAVATAVVAGATLAVSPADAALIGSIAISGDATVQDYSAVGQTKNVVFKTVDFASGTGDFASIGAAGVSINALPLTLLSETSAGSTISRTFANAGVDPFINFGTRTIDGATNTLSFILDPGSFSGAKNTTNGLLTLSALGPINGKFVFGTETLAAGFLSASRSGNIAANGAFQLTLTTQAIPTPALLPGLIALGAGMLRKRKDEASEEG